MFGHANGLQEYMLNQFQCQIYIRSSWEWLETKVPRNALDCQQLMYEHSNKVKTTFFDIVQCQNLLVYHCQNISTQIWKILIFNSPGICDCNTLLIAKLVRKSSVGEVGMMGIVSFVN